MNGLVSIEGCEYPLKDWSRRGFSATAYKAGHYPGDKVEMTVSVDIDDEPLVFSCRAVVVWVDRDRKELAGVFTHLDTRVQEQIMSAIFAQSAPTQQGAVIHA